MDETATLSPSECPTCGRRVQGIYRSGGQQHEHGPVHPWITQLQPCGHVLAGRMGSLDHLDPEVRKVVEDTVENWRRRPRFDCEACEDSGVCTVCRGGSINGPGLSCLTCQNTHQCQRCNWFVLAEARAQIDQTGPLTEVPSGKDEAP